MKNEKKDTGRVSQEQGLDGRDLQQNKLDVAQKNGSNEQLSGGEANEELDESISSDERGGESSLRQDINTHFPLSGNESDEDLDRAMESGSDEE